MGALKKPTCMPAAPKVKKPEVKKIEVDTTIQKAEIEHMKKLLTEKFKDPELAKKAAMIINDMLNKK